LLLKSATQQKFNTCLTAWHTKEEKLYYFCAPKMV